MHVGLHQLLRCKVSSSVGHPGKETLDLYEVDFCEAIIIAWFLNIEDRDDVLMVEVSQQLHLPQGSEAEHRVVEGRYLLDCNLLAGGFMQGRTGGCQLKL